MSGTRSTRGFTLIELLIAISIMAVLATIGIIQFSSAQSVGRDSKRKQDLRSLAIALELYRQKNGAYPITASDTVWNSAGDFFKSTSTLSPWVTGLDTNYINKLPADPKQSSIADSMPTTAGIYAYAYWSGKVPSSGVCTAGDGTYYVLVTRLENSTDPTTNKNKGGYKHCDTTTTLFNYATTPINTAYENLFVLTSDNN